MPSIKLSGKSAQGLEQGVYYDTELKGFGLRVGSTVSTWFAEYRPGAGGRGVAKKRTKIGTMDKLSAEEARAAARRILAGVALGSDPAKTKAAERASKPFNEVAEDYISTHVDAKRKAATADYYRYLMALHIKLAFGSKRFNTVTTVDVADLHNALGKAGKRYVANRALALISAVFNWADNSGANPVRGIERFKEEGRQDYLTPEEMARLGDAMREAETVGIPHQPSTSKHAPKDKNRTVHGPHAVGAIRLLMLTGMRLREVLDLEWSQVDQGRGVLFLPDSKTGRKTVVLSDAAMEVLNGLPKVGRYVVAGRNAGLEDEAPRADLKKPWDAIRNRAGLQRFRIHDLRHSFGSVGAGSGLGLPVIGALLGHADVKTTARYAHVATDASKRAADAIAGQISAAIGKK